MRRFLTVSSLGLALIGGVWTLWLSIIGGIDANVLGVSITSNEPVRPFLLTTISLLVFVGVGPGFGRAWSWLDETDAGIQPRRVVIGAGILSTALAAVIAAIGLTYSTATIGGADSYGYVSQADLWLQGNLRVEQPWVAELPWPNARWTATPLGYRPVDAEAAGTIVPVFPPGLPLIMAAAKAIFGHDAVFWIVPLSAFVLIVATFAIGRRLGSSHAGLAGAWFVATSPIVLFMITAPMSDVPAAAAWTLAFYFGLRSGGPSALIAGLAGSAAIAIRPNLFMLAVPIGIMVAMRGRGRAALLGLGGMVPGVIGLAWLNTMLYGSAASLGYGSMDGAFAFDHVWPNVTRYVRWLAASHTWIAVARSHCRGRAASAALAIRTRPDRPHLWCPVGRAGAGAVLLYLVFDAWWYLRFLLPAFPFIGLGVATVLLAGTRHRRPVLALLSVWIILTLGLYNLRTGSRMDVLGAWRLDRQTPDVAAAVRHDVGENGVVFTMIHSGSLRYYGGRMTLRYDQLQRDWLDRAVTWLESRGVRAYALLEEWETPQFVAHFEGQQIATRLKDHAVWFHHGARTIGLYDLTRPAVTPPRTIAGRDPAALRAVPPATTATLFLR